MAATSSVGWACPEENPMLREKGVISAAEFARIESGSGNQQHVSLLEILRSKGILSAADVANVSNQAPRPTEQVTSDAIQQVEQFVDRLFVMCPVGIDNQL